MYTVHQLEWVPSKSAKEVDVGDEVDVSYMVDVNDTIDPIKNVDVGEGWLYITLYDIAFSQRVALKSVDYTLH